MQSETTGCWSQQEGGWGWRFYDDACANIIRQSNVINFQIGLRFLFLLPGNKSDLHQTLTQANLCQTIAAESGWSQLSARPGWLRPAKASVGKKQNKSPYTPRYDFYD